MSTPHPSHIPARTGVVQTSFRLLLGAALVFAGTSHLTWSRTEFQAQVTHWLPLPADLVVIASGLVVIASGFVELVLGGALVALPRHRTIVGWIVAVFFVAIFPGNISQYANRIDGFGLDTDRARAIRLVFQPVLVSWALWSTGVWQAWWHRRQTFRR